MATTSSTISTATRHQRDVSHFLIEEFFMAPMVSKLFVIAPVGPAYRRRAGDSFLPTVIDGRALRQFTWRARKHQANRWRYSNAGASREESGNTEGQTVTLYL